MMNEAETRAKLIDPAIKARGWGEEHIRREETAGRIAIIRGKPVRSRLGRTDYTLRIRGASDSQPVAVALIEAKAEDKHPGHGLEQGKVYSRSKLLNVPFVYATNGHLFVEYDRFTGLTSDPRPMAEFPTPGELWQRYEQGMGFQLTDEAARPLLTPYAAGGESQRRYYQDAAIRAVLETVAVGRKRALLSLATGSGKTFIAAHLLHRLAEAGHLRKALFVCDRTELRDQGIGAMKQLFGSDAAEVTAGSPQKNARVLVATYQTLGIDRDESDASFLLDHYPEDYFSHIVIDECHRSAWGKWSEVLRRNPSAVQVGLTATPREIALPRGVEAEDLGGDRRLMADNVRHFGEPVYAYDLAQGINDGYLAPCEIKRRSIFLEAMEQPEAATGLRQDQLAEKDLRHPVTGRALTVAELEAEYRAASFEQLLVLPDRVQALARDFFHGLLDHGGPEQKAIVFCAGDQHADLVANALNNLYARWCRDQGREPRTPYAFKGNK